MNATIALLRARRSVPPAAMSGPGPTPQETGILLALAARVPDHGKLAPWRFILFEGAGRQRAGQTAPHQKIPEWEQVLSAGAVCMNLMVAANALGFASSWLTDW